MATQLPEGEQPMLRIIPMPADTNANGTIFGGWVMSHVDLAGSVPAVKRAGGPVVTVAVNSFTFREPVFVGDLVQHRCLRGFVKHPETTNTPCNDEYSEGEPARK